MVESVNAKRDAYTAYSEKGAATINGEIGLQANNSVINSITNIHSVINLKVVEAEAASHEEVNAPTVPQIGGSLIEYVSWCLGYGDVLLQRGNFGESNDHYIQGYRGAQKMMETEADKTVANGFMGCFCLRIGDFCMMSRNFEDLRFYREGCAALTRLSQDIADNFIVLRDIAMFKQRMGDALWQRGGTREAMHTYKEAHSIMTKLTENDAFNFSWQRDLFILCDRIARLLQFQRKNLRAMMWYRQAHSIHQRLSSLGALRL